MDAFENLADLAEPELAKVNADEHFQGDWSYDPRAWAKLIFIVPVEALPLIEDELSRLEKLAPLINPDISSAFRRGLFLEFALVLSALTPDESLM